MPVLTCGGMRFQDGWQDKPMAEIPADKQANLAACVRRALELGINHVETAQGYGPSERQLGQILPTLPRDEIIVQTKANPREDADQFAEEVHDSIDRLGVGWLDMFAFHGINNEQTLAYAAACLPVVRDMQRQGKVRFVGFSTHGPPDIVLKAVCHDDGAGGFDYANVHWFYIYQWNWPAIEAATRRDMGVFIISPTDKGGHLYRPPAKLVDLCRPLHPIVFNDLFCLSHPQVHTLSIGATRPGDYDLHAEAVGMLDRADELLPPILDRLAQALRQAADEDLLDPFHLPLPAWQDTPGEVSIPTILWLWNLLSAFDLDEYARARYNLLGRGGHWFPGNTAAEMDEAAIADALGEAGLAKKVLAVLRSAHEALADDPQRRLSQSEA